MSKVEKSLFIEQLQDKASVSAPFLVKHSSVAMGRNGKPYINLVLMDKTGEVEARIWDRVPDFANRVVRDSLVTIQGKCQSYQGRIQVVIKEAQVLREDEVVLEDYLPEGHKDPEALYGQLKNYVSTMQDPYLRALAESILIEDEEIARGLLRAPAAKSVHHAYPAGLLEHVVSITGILDHLADHYGSMVNRDLLFLGGFLHDIGKIWELTYEKSTDYTDEGRLIGHLVMGVELVERKIQALESQAGRLPGAFPEEMRLLVKHLILAHHGRLEYGSPKRPKCLEALIVHMIDDLDSKVNAISEFIRADQNPGKWTNLNRQHERFFYKTDWLCQPQ